MRNERRTSGSGMGAAETCAGNRASAPRPHFHGLVLLGLGWNFAFIGATTAVARVAPQDRATAQGLNDLLVFSAVALASLLAGVIEYSAGWRALNLCVLPLLCLVALAIAPGMRAHRDRASTAA